MYYWFNVTIKSVELIKLLLDSNWCENDYNWLCFHSNEILCDGWWRGKICFSTNMTNFNLIYVKIAISKWFVHYFSWYLGDKDRFFFNNFGDHLFKDLTRQHIDEKMQSFHVNDLIFFTTKHFKDFKQKCMNYIIDITVLSLFVYYFLIHTEMFIF